MCFGGGGGGVTPTPAEQQRMDDTRALGRDPVESDYKLVLDPDADQGRPKAGVTYYRGTRGYAYTRQLKIPSAPVSSGLNIPVSRREGNDSN